MTVKYCIYTPFDLQFDPGGRKGWRYQKCAGRPAWWPERAEVMRDYAVPGIQGLDDQDFEWFLTFDPEHVRDGRTAPILRACSGVSNRVVVTEETMDTSEERFMFSGTHIWSIAERYRDCADWVVMLWLDSDDLYRKDVWEHVKAVEPREGLAIGFEDAYTYDTRDGKLYGWLGGREGPPPFFGYCWPNRVLHDYERMKAYAREHWFTCVHHMLNLCTERVWLPKGLFLNTMNGNNCTKDIHNPDNIFIWEHMQDEVCEPERTAVLAGFGIEG